MPPRKNVGTSRGKGKIWSSRRRKLVKDNIQGITKPDIRRLARRGGVKRLSGMIYDDIRSALRSRLEKILERVCYVVDGARRKTVTVMDIVFVLKGLGSTLYGFDPVYGVTGVDNRFNPDKFFPNRRPLAAPKPPAAAPLRPSAPSHVRNGPQVSTSVSQTASHSQSQGQSQVPTQPSQAQRSQPVHTQSQSQTQSQPQSQSQSQPWTQVLSPAAGRYPAIGSGNRARSNATQSQRPMTPQRRPMSVVPSTPTPRRSQSQNQSLIQRLQAEQTQMQARFALDGIEDYLSNRGDADDVKDEDDREDDGVSTQRAESLEL